MEENVVRIDEKDGFYVIYFNDKLRSGFTCSIENIALDTAKGLAKAYNAKLIVAWDIAPIE